MPLPLLRLFAARRSTAARSRPARARLRLAPLEDRVVPSTLYVENDRIQYPEAGYTSIQAAVNAARPGDTIQVYPGTYNEIVTVDKAGLKLLGDQVNYLARKGDSAAEVVVTASTPAGTPS